MSVWCRQAVDDGRPDETLEVGRHTPDQTDAELLAAKARGADDKGWTVTWTGERSFTAVKDRWGGLVCTREFWAD